MSIAATDYALEHAAKLPTRLQPVLFALAARANSRTGATYGGRWLADTLGVTPGRMRHRVAELAETGLITVTHRPGRASIIHVGICPQVAPQVRDLDGEGSRQGCATVAPGVRDGRATGARVSGSVSGSVSGAGDGVGTGCGHRWVTADGDCPTCIAAAG